MNSIKVNELSVSNGPAILKDTDKAILRELGLVIMIRARGKHTRLG